MRTRWYHKTRYKIWCLVHTVTTISVWCQPHHLIINQHPRIYIYNNLPFLLLLYIICINYVTPQNGYTTRNYVPKQRRRRRRQHTHKSLQWRRWNNCVTERKREIYNTEAAITEANEKKFEILYIIDSLN